MRLNTKILSIAAGFAAVAIIGAAIGAGVASRAAEPSVVGVVDIDRVSSVLEEFKAPSDELKAKQLAWSTELQALQDRIKSITDEIDLIPETDQDARVQKLIDRALVDSELKTKGQMYQQASDLAQAQLFQRMYNRIVEGVGEIADRDGYDVVIVDDRIIPIPATNRAAQDDAIASKKILYANEATDLTDEVITLLDNQFNAGQ